MVDNVLEAYEKMVNEKYTLKSKLKNMKFMNKILVAISILGAVVVFILLSLNSFVALIAEGIWLLVIYLFASLISFFQRKEWKENIEHYTDLLDILKAVLMGEEFNLYNKNKMKQLRRKIQNEICEEEAEREKGKQNRLNTFQTYFLPVISFICGAITREKSTADLVSMGIIAIIFMAGLIWTKVVIIEFHTQINGNLLYKKKRLAKQLQDLIDREFDIEDADLL